MSQQQDGPRMGTCAEYLRHPNKRVVIMEITPEEKTMLSRILNNQYTGGGYKRATFIDKVCRSKADRAVLESVCQKGLVETGLGGTVAGDTYRACWLTEKGRTADKAE
jgi:hypothetical protein